MGRATLISLAATAALVLACGKSGEKKAADDKAGEDTKKAEGDTNSEKPAGGKDTTKLVDPDEGPQPLPVDPNDEGPPKPATGKPSDTDAVAMVNLYLEAVRNKDVGMLKEAVTFPYWHMLGLMCGKAPIDKIYEAANAKELEGLTKCLFGDMFADNANFVLADWHVTDKPIWIGDPDVEEPRKMDPKLAAKLAARKDATLVRGTISGDGITYWCTAVTVGTKDGAMLAAMACDSETFE